MQLETAVLDQPILERYKMTQTFKVISTKTEGDVIASEEETKTIKDFYDKINQQQLPTIIEQGEQHSWIQTYSGRKFFPLNPVLDSIVIQDIAHALSMQCRFTGHCKFHYSIAYHSILVSYLCDEEFSLHGLLHDASEAYIADISSPIKRTVDFERYREIEKHLQDMIYERFGLSKEEPPSVKKADRLMLATEASQLLSPLHSEWKLPCNPAPFKIEQLSPEVVEKMFLVRFHELIDKLNEEFVLQGK